MSAAAAAELIPELAAKSWGSMIKGWHNERTQLNNLLARLEAQKKIRQMMGNGKKRTKKTRKCRGGKFTGNDVRDILFGPVGWARIISRKVKEKKARDMMKELGYPQEVIDQI